MAKALRTAAFVVGAVALAATGVGALVSIGAIAASATTATIATIGTIASVASAVLSVAASASAPAGTIGGNATKFKIDKEAGIPYVIGRTYVGGNCVHRQYYDDPGSKMRNQRESWVTVLSLGPVHSVGPLLIDKTPVAFDGGGQAIGTFHGNMWLDTQLGACPEARALHGPTGDFPGWNASSKLSGLAADLWTLDFDSKGVKFPNGVPDRGRVLEGVLVYDPREDSTYPGGSGPCRLGDESTYVYSECPGPHAITWAYGRFQNGVRTAGGEMSINGIDLAPFVEWSNVCDLHGWKAGGLVYTDADDPWDVLKMICQAGAAEPMPVGAQLSVVYSAPRVSIGTITSADIIGDVDVPAIVSRRVRRNTIIPRVRLEAQGWEEVPLDPISVPDYVTVDGGRRPKDIRYPLIQDADQGACIAMYDMLNARELDGIVLPAKVYALGYRPGDCLTVQIPEANLIDRPVIVREREIDSSTAGVTLTCRTETAGKHPLALGQTGVAPPTPDLSSPGIDRSAPDADDWSAAGTTLSAAGVTVPAIVITGTSGALAADTVIFDYRPHADGADPDTGWIGASFEAPTVTRKEITSVTSTTAYDLGVRYRVRGALSDRLILGPVTTGAYAGVRGDDGTDGSPGEPGADGTSTYVHIAYADSADGHTNFTAGAPGARTYIGVRTDTTLADSTNPDDYAWSLIKGADGSDGAPGGDALLLDVNVSALEFQADYLGNLKPGQIDQTIDYSFRRGGTDVSSSATFTPEFSGCDGSIDATGLVTFAGVTASGYARVGATQGGDSLPAVKVPITLRKDNAPPSTDAVATTNIGTTVTSTSYAATPDATAIVTTSGTVLRGALTLGYSPDGRGNTYVEGRFGYRAAGSSSGWTLFASGAVNGSQGRIGGTPSEPINEEGSLSINQTETVGVGRYEVGIFLRRSGGGHDAIAGGTMQAKDG